jgi:hypothetical protein
MRGITIYKTVVDIVDHPLSIYIFYRDNSLLQCSMYNLLLLVSDRFFDYFNVETKY